MRFIGHQNQTLIKTTFQALKGQSEFGIPKIIARDRIGLKTALRPHQEHLQACMEWLRRAQDASQDRGVSAFYQLVDAKWAPSYPETTGYLIPTFLHFAHTSGRDEFSRLATEMADWLLTLQLPEGGFPIGPLWDDMAPEPLVFDTGQILHGLLSIYEQTGSPAYLESAQRAGNWLIAILDPDGGWRQFTFKGQSHAYNVRVAWALLRLAQISAELRYESAAIRNLDWALGQQKANGWFENASFDPYPSPLTHTLAYTIRGFLESSLLLQEDRYLASAEKAALALLKQEKKHGVLQGVYDADWSPEVSWRCPCSIAQVAIIWMIFYQIQADQTFLEAASRANRWIMQHQYLEAPEPGIQGAIPGPVPIEAPYLQYSYVNWAAKFFADSLMMEMRLRKLEY